MKVFLALALATGLPFANGLVLDVNSTDSIRNASATIAYGLMSWYVNNQTTTPPTDIGTFAQPVYWWEAGAVWGGLIDYWAYTGDTSYNPTVTQALLAQTGPDNNYMPPAYFSQLGNDDQAFWAITCLAAVEYGFPTPPGNSSTVWLDLAEAVFNSMVPRWDTSSCGGGLRWQIFPSNQGYTYKNTIANGGLFQISARLYRYTGNETYLHWAEKTWDWMRSIKLISYDYNVFDGSNDQINCSQVNHDLWTYNPAILIYGTAMLYNYTQLESWGNRTAGLLEWVGGTFFSPYKNSTDIMFERGCEPFDTCNTDEFSFKAYLARWMAKAAVVAPFITDYVDTLLTASALGAAKSCSGPTSGTTCGVKWYTGGYDGNYGVGQELSALEVVQSLLLFRGNESAPHRYPLHSSDVTIKVVNPSSTFSATPEPTLPISRSGPTGRTSRRGAKSPMAAFSGTDANATIRTLTDLTSWGFMFVAFTAILLYGGILVR